MGLGPVAPHLCVLNTDDNGSGSFLLTVSPSSYALNLLGKPLELLEHQRRGLGPLNARQRQYLFNAGEGLQRRAAERGVRLDGVNACLFSRLRGGAAGGLSGLVYELLERGAARLEVYGPRGTTRFVEAMRSSFLRRSPELATAEFSGELGECWQDEDVVIVPVFLSGQCGSVGTHRAPASGSGSDSTAGFTNRCCPFCTRRIVGPRHVDTGGTRCAAEVTEERDLEGDGSSVGSAEPPLKRQRQDQYCSAASHKNAAGVSSLCYICYIPSPASSSQLILSGLSDVSSAYAETFQGDVLAGCSDSRSVEGYSSDDSSSGGVASSSSEGSGENSSSSDSEHDGSDTGSQGVRSVCETYQVLVVVDVPDASLLWKLEGHPALACLQKRHHSWRGSPSRPGVSGGYQGVTVLHMSPAHVQRSAEYLRWIRNTGLQQPHVPKNDNSSTAADGSGSVLVSANHVSLFNSYTHNPMASGTGEEEIPYSAATRLRMRLTALDPESYSLPHLHPHHLPLLLARDGTSSNDAEHLQVASNDLMLSARLQVQGKQRDGLRWEQVFRCCLPTTDASGNMLHCREEQRQRLLLLLGKRDASDEATRSQESPASSQLSCDEQEWSLRQPTLRNVDNLLPGQSNRLLQQHEHRSRLPCHEGRQPRENVAMAALKARLTGDVETYRTLMAATLPQDTSSARGLHRSERALYELLQSEYQQSAAVHTDYQRHEKQGDALHFADVGTDHNDVPAVSPFEMIILGTGCKSPSRLRNCASIYFRLPQPPHMPMRTPDVPARQGSRDGCGASARSTIENVACAGGENAKGFSILIDAGEGSLAALQREFGGFEASLGQHGRHGIDAVLLSLTMVWVSHMHADHHAGLPAILDARHAAILRAAVASTSTSVVEDKKSTAALEFRQPPPLLVVGPAALRPLLEAHCIPQKQKHYHHQQQQQAGPVWLFSKISDFNRADNPLRRTLLDPHMATASAATRGSNLAMRGVPTGFGVGDVGKVGAMRRDSSVGGADGGAGCGYDSGQRYDPMNGSGSLLHLSSVPVRHCPDAWGLVLAAAPHHAAETTAPIALVYSGDTMSCPALVAAGRRWSKVTGTSSGTRTHTTNRAPSTTAVPFNREQHGRWQLPPGIVPPTHGADHQLYSQQPHRLLLVHEATFHDTAEGREHAARKRHSTVGDALSAGLAMGAWRTVLTHFSNRHPAFPVPTQSLGHAALTLTLPLPLPPPQPARVVRKVVDVADTRPVHTNLVGTTATVNDAALAQREQEGDETVGGRVAQGTTRNLFDLSDELVVYGRRCGIVALDGLQISQANAGRLPRTMPVIEAALNAAAEERQQTRLQQKQPEVNTTAAGHTNKAGKEEERSEAEESRTPS